MKKSVFLSCNQIFLVMMQENYPQNDADYAKQDTARESTANYGETTEHAEPMRSDEPTSVGYTDMDNNARQQPSDPRSNEMLNRNDGKQCNNGCCGSSNRGEY